VTGGLFLVGLGCLVRILPIFVGWTIPGEYEDMDVGVDVGLQGPGESEYLVEGLLTDAEIAGVGGFCFGGAFVVKPANSGTIGRGSSALLRGSIVGIEDVGGRAIPRTASGYGSLYPPGRDMEPRKPFRGLSSASDASDFVRDRVGVLWSIDGTFRRRTFRGFSFSVGVTAFVEDLNPNDLGAAGVTLELDSELRLDKLLDPRGRPEGRSSPNPAFIDDASAVLMFCLFLAKKEVGVLEFSLREGRGIPLEDVVFVAAGCAAPSSEPEGSSSLGLRL
jgi:hypothetical protein